MVASEEFMRGYSVVTGVYVLNIDAAEVGDVEVCDWRRMSSKLSRDRSFESLHCFNSVLASDLLGILINTY